MNKAVSGCSDQKPCFPDGVCHYPLPCKRQKPLTRADAIRQMTDEQLADLIASHLDMVELGYCQNKKECDEQLKKGETPSAWCRVCLIEWLKSPEREDSADGSQIQLPVR